MADTPVAGHWWRLSRRSVVAVVVAIAAGTGLGVLVDLISPNPTYGAQIEAIGLALLIALVIAVVRVLRPMLPMALGLAIGVILGVAVGPGPPPPLGSVSGTLNVRLGKPAIIDGTPSAACIVVDGTLQFLDTTDQGALRLADGRWFSISLGPGEQEPAALDRPLDIVVVIHSTTADGSPTETRMASDASSTVSISNAGATGSMAFSGLVLNFKGELREPIDVAGSVTWNCVD